jgi:hypothetical protein
MTEMLRSVGKKVKLVHGEVAESVDHSWISVFDEDTGQWEGFDSRRNNLDIKPDYIKKAEVESWDDIKDQIYEDQATLRERKLAKGLYKEEQ